MKIAITKPLLLTSIMMAISSVCYAEKVDFRILQTTDLHANMLSYDYYNDKPTEKFGYVRTIGLIQEKRAEAKNSVLLDSGDLIQGSPLGNYIVQTGLKEGEIHPIYAAMNSMGYDVAGFGDHEFNFGLEFLQQAIKGANFPYINSNVFDAKTNKPYFTQYLIKDTPVTDRDGKVHTIKIGYMAFVPPQIMMWDGNKLAGRVTAKDIKQTAEQLVPEMKKAGAELIIAISHSGIVTTDYQPMAEESAYYLSQIKGIDAIIAGHQHKVFPSDDFVASETVDLQKGRLNGVPTVMAGAWGSHVGMIDLVLDNSQGQWTVEDSQSSTPEIFDSKANKALYPEDPALSAMLQPYHQHTNDMVSKTFGKISEPLNSYLSLIQNQPFLQIINDAQHQYVDGLIKDNVIKEKLPVLSVAAPFKSGGSKRKPDPNNYLMIAQGDISLRDAFNIYPHTNTLTVVKVNGKQVKEWLECSAAMFNQIDKNTTAPQDLINWGFHTFNFDTIDDVNYQIDVTQPARYDANCDLINNDAHRVVNLAYQSKAVDDADEFLLATNNFRANRDKFVRDFDSVVHTGTAENREIIINYLSDLSTQNKLEIKATNNWQFLPIETNKQLDIRFETNPNDIATRYIKQAINYEVEYLNNNEAGFAVYRINLNKK